MLNQSYTQNITGQREQNKRKWRGCWPTGWENIEGAWSRSQSPCHVFPCYGVKGLSLGQGWLLVSSALCPAFVPKEPVTNYCWQREKQLGLRGAVTMHPPSAVWWDPGRQSSVEGAERILPSSHTHTSRTGTIPLPESRDPSGERGILASPQPKGVNSPVGSAGWPWQVLGCTLLGHA